MMRCAKMEGKPIRTKARKKLPRGFYAKVGRLLRVKNAVRLDGRSNFSMIRKLKSGEYRLYSRKQNPKTGKRRNLGTFKSLKAAKDHERAVQFFKRH
jgi:hypothetical protein